MSGGDRLALFDLGIDTLEETHGHFLQALVAVEGRPTAEAEAGVTIFVDGDQVDLRLRHRDLPANAVDHRLNGGQVSAIHHLRFGEVRQFEETIAVGLGGHEQLVSTRRKLRVGGAIEKSFKQAFELAELVCVTKCQ